MSLDNIHAGESSQSIVDRIMIWKETKDYYKSFPSIESEIIQDLSNEVLANTPQRFPSTSVEFVKGDCVDEAVRLSMLNYNPLLLNMADWFYAGGCVDGGSRAQEEELFRRSNYFRYLHQKYYPLQEYTTILSNKVEFIRRGIEQNYAWMKEPVYIDCVAAPALQNPPVDSNRTQFKYDQHAQVMKKKIRMLFHIAAKNGNNSLVLSAWGCGAFRCPVEHVAKLFKEVVDENKGVVKHISFAIHGTNFEPFQRSYLNQ